MEVRRFLPPRSLFARVPCCKFSERFAPIAAAEVLSHYRVLGLVQDHAGGLYKVFDDKVSYALHVCAFLNLFAHQNCAGTGCSTCQEIQLTVSDHETGL